MAPARPPFGWQRPPLMSAARTEPAIAAGNGLSRRHTLTSFNHYLVTYGVGGIVRPAAACARHVREPAAPSRSRSRRPSNGRTSSRRCAMCALCDPRCRPVEPVRLSQPAFDVCAGGAPESAHKHYSLIDLVPLRPTTARSDADIVLVHGRRGPDSDSASVLYAFSDPCDKASTGLWEPIRAPRCARRSSARRTSRPSISRRSRSPSRSRLRRSLSRLRRLHRRRSIRWRQRRRPRPRRRRNRL